MLYVDVEVAKWLGRGFVPRVPWRVFRLQGVERYRAALLLFC